MNVPWDLNQLFPHWSKVIQQTCTTSWKRFITNAVYDVIGVKYFIQNWFAIFTKNIFSVSEWLKMGYKMMFIFLLIPIVLAEEELVWESDACSNFNSSSCPQRLYNDGKSRTHIERCPPPRKLYERFDPDNPCCPKVKLFKPSAKLKPSKLVWLHLWRKVGHKWWIARRPSERCIELLLSRLHDHREIRGDWFSRSRFWTWWNIRGSGRSVWIHQYILGWTAHRN